MDAVDFIKERNRMCEFYDNGRCHGGCPAYGGISCNDLTRITDQGYALVKIVEKWSSEHPQKTMLQDFLEKFPKAPLQSDGTPSLCPYKCGYTREDYCKKFNPNPTYKTCLDCWSRPVED